MKHMKTAFAMTLLFSCASRASSYDSQSTIFDQVANYAQHAESTVQEYEERAGSFYASNRSTINAALWGVAIGTGLALAHKYYWGSKAKNNDKKQQRSLRDRKGADATSPVVVLSSRKQPSQAALDAVRALTPVDPTLTRIEATLKAAQGATAPFTPKTEAIRHLLDRKRRTEFTLERTTGKLKHANLAMLAARRVTGHVEPAQLNFDDVSPIARPGSALRAGAPVHRPGSDANGVMSTAS